MIPPCWLLTYGMTLKSSLDSIVQSPGALCRTRFFAVLVVVVRSPASAVIDSAPQTRLQKSCLLQPIAKPKFGGAGAEPTRVRTTTPVGTKEKTRRFTVGFRR